MSILRRGRHREGERIMPRSLPELDAYVEQQIDWWLVREDLVVLSATGLRELAKMAGLEVVDEAYRRGWVMRRRETS